MNQGSQEFYIHFDLEGEDNHSILLNHSIMTEETVRTVIFELNQKAFGGKSDIQVYVFPAEEGGLVKRFGVGVLTVGTFLLGLLGQDTANGIIKGLTGKERKDHVEGGTIIVKEMVIGFLEKKNTDLASSGIDYDTFYKAYDAKNKFYQETLKNLQVRGLGFDKEHNFPIPRNEFVYRIVDLKSKTSSIDPVEKFHKVKVVSPINTKEDKSLSRQIKDIQKKSQRFSVYMDDVNFYDFFLSNPFFINTMIVKISYLLKRDEKGDIKIARGSIINVYQYNEIEFLPLPENCFLEKAPRQFEGSDNFLILPEATKQNGGLFEGLDFG